jgi:hypothetical protein
MKTFTKLINAAIMAELTDIGILVPMRVFSCRKPDMAGATTSRGEWTDKAAEDGELVIIGDVITEWQRLAPELKTIVFGASIHHCQELAREFNEAGIPAAVFCAHTEDDARNQILQDFSTGAVKVLVSVEALAKGFDVPDVGCVCDCRPLRKSLSTAIQMWGRGLRSCPEAGKTECLLLDFSGNIIRFADDFSEIFFNGLASLDDGEKLDKAVRKDEPREPKSCPKCGYSPMGRKCIGCGFEPAPASMVAHLPGEMSEVVMCGKKMLATDIANLFNQVATYEKRHGRPETLECRVAHRFRDIAGAWPPKGSKAETAMNVEPTAATVSKIKSLRIAYVRGRARC